MLSVDDAKKSCNATYDIHWELRERLQIMSGMNVYNRAQKILTSVSTVGGSEINILIPHLSVLSLTLLLTTLTHVSFLFRVKDSPAISIYYACRNEHLLLLQEYNLYNSTMHDYSTVFMYPYPQSFPNLVRSSHGPN